MTNVGEPFLPKGSFSLKRVNRETEVWLKKNGQDIGVHGKKKARRLLAFPPYQHIFH